MFTKKYAHTQTHETTANGHTVFACNFCFPSPSKQGLGSLKEEVVVVGSYLSISRRFLLLGIRFFTRSRWSDADALSRFQLEIIDRESVRGRRKQLLFWCDIFLSRAEKLLSDRFYDARAL